MDEDNDPKTPGRGRPPSGRHRWGINLWVTDAEEARLRVFFARRLESLSEAARRLLLREAEEQEKEEG